MDYKKNKKYFQPGLKIKHILIAAFIVIALFLSKPIMGILSGAIVGGIIYLLYFGGPSDQEIDEICAKEVSDAREKALRKLGIDEDEVTLIEPILIKGPSFRNIRIPYKAKQGKDGRWRSSNYEAVYLFFSEQQVYSYTYRFSLIIDEKNESTDEYFYGDIVSVSTSSDTVTFQDASNNKIKPINYEKFKLTTSGGTSITCSMWDFGEVEKSIQGMKQILRQKKTATNA